MSYTTNKLDLAKKILRSVSPALIFVNVPVGVDFSPMREFFKTESWHVYGLPDLPNLLDMEKWLAGIHAYMHGRKTESNMHIPLVLFGNIADPDVISNIFIDEFYNFTYVYMVPADAKAYRERIVTVIDSLPNPTKLTPKKLADGLFIEASTTYKKHIEAFDNRIFTILT